ncbi:MAG: hypothetical protein EZS28_014586 [Streblomastix strix]|uniref:SPRY domain-containing protein n=1 Tax=Streblomastix strix TaxID=222440 RepID=A0A5J4W4G2_9EUKA|nr:MAG: hypothetical protein EZS28_014586 [Streblomastix strix]
MDNASEYNVIGGLLGLGEFILLAIMTEMIIPQQIQQFLVVCKKIYKLKEHPRFAIIMQSIIQIAPECIIKKESQGKQIGNKFIHSSNFDQCTIAIDPVVSEGIARFEVVFGNTRKLKSMGIADASVSFAASKGPPADEKMTLIYRDQNGYLDHITYWTIKNGSYEDGQRISAIVDMTSNPRKVVFYVDDIEQPNFVIGIPSEIRFWAYLFNPSSSFTVTKFERLVQYTQQGVAGSKALEWGKEWK